MILQNLFNREQSLCNLAFNNFLSCQNYCLCLLTMKHYRDYFWSRCKVINSRFHYFYSSHKSLLLSSITKSLLTTSPEDLRVISSFETRLLSYAFFPAINLNAASLCTSTKFSNASMRLLTVISFLS